MIDLGSEPALLEGDEGRVALLARALACLGEGVCMTRADDVVLFVNEAFCRIYGYRRDELIGRPVGILRPKDFDGRTDREIREGTLGEGFFGEIQNVTKDGREILVSLRTAVVRGDRGEPLALIGVVRDVTEARNAERALRDSETRYRALFEGANDGVMLFDASSFVDCNRTACILFGRSKGEIVGRRPWELSPPIQPGGRDSREAATGYIEAALRGRPQRFEWEHTRGDGSRFTAEVSLSAVEAAGETVIQALVRDVTERRATVEAERKRLNQLGAVNRIARVLTGSLDPEKVITTAVRETQSRLGLHSVILVMMDREAGALGSQAVAGAYEGMVPADYHRRVWRGLIGHAARSGETLVVNDVWNDDRFVAAFEGERSTRSEVCVPVRLAGEVLGVLDVQSNRPDAFDDTDVQTLETIADQIAVSVRNAALFAKAERDLAERIRAQERLRISESRYRDLVESSGDLICTHDLAGTMLSVNLSALRLLGYSADEMVGRSLADFMRDTWKAGFDRYLEEIAVHGRARGVLEVLGKGGSRVYWEYHNSLRSDVDPPVVRGVARDISDRVRAERALRAERDRARLYLDLAGVLFVALDEQARVTLVNRKTCEILGCNEDGMVGRSWFEDFVPSRDRGDAKSVFERLMLGEPHQYAESSVLTSGGDERLVAWRSTAVVDLEGRVIGTLSSGEDVTERRHLEEQLRHSQRLEAMGRLAGGVAHDFNNLLQAMLVTAQLIRVEQDPVRLPEAIREIEEHILRGASLARQLLLFARRGVTRPERTDLNDLVRKASRLLSRLVRENVILSLRLDQRPLPVDADRAQLEQVLTNLVVNSMDAMPTGGDLCVATGQDADEAWFEVRDTGCGIPADLRERIFDPFFTTKEGTKGTGLGLAVAHGIVSEHRGRIELAAESGSGSCFRVVLPLATRGEERDDRVSEGEDGGVPRGAGERVLLVEDNDQIRVLFERMLRQLGYAVTVVASGEEVRELPDEPGFDLLITDVMLPGEPGTKIARRLAERHPTLGVILMSGYAEEDLLVQEIVAGGVRFLQKPIELVTLAREVREALDSRGGPSGQPVRRP